MLELDIIEPSNSEWNVPVVLVPKPDGTIRVCIDFREVNKISRFDSYPIPRVDEMIEQLGCSGYISTLDLCKGYRQVPSVKTDRLKTAFSTSTGLCHFKVLPSGLHGAPATFQRMMDITIETT